MKHGRHIAEVLRKQHGQDAGTVFGDTLPSIRDETLTDFKAGRLKYLVNVNVLTTGFDAPNIDCVALVRPTNSPGLYYQAVGRGFRLHPDKEDCLVLDFGGNVLRHGPVDAISIKEPGKGGGGPAPAKECPKCRSVVATGFKVCPDCGFEFPEPERAQHDPKASEAGILSGQMTTEEFEILDTHCTVHTKRGAAPDAPKSMRVEYRVNWYQTHSEWVCFEHTGFARHKAEQWWRQRSRAPVPDTSEEAVALAKSGALSETLTVTVRSVAGEKYDRIIGYQLGPIPDWREPGWDEEEPVHDEVPIDYEEIPF